MLIELPRWVSALAVASYLPWWVKHQVDILSNPVTYSAADSRGDDNIMYGR